jgi:hypothetical protein
VPTLRKDPLCVYWFWVGASLPGRKNFFLPLFFYWLAVGRLLPGSKNFPYQLWYGGPGHHADWLPLAGSFALVITLEELYVLLVLHVSSLTHCLCFIARDFLKYQKKSKEEINGK